MDIVSLIVGGMLALLMAYVLVRLAYTIYTNVINGIKFRQLLESKVRDYRLSRMLEALGFDVRKYVHREAVIDIENNLTNCANCENTQTCDEQLSTGSVSIDSIDYCNNESALNRLHSKTETGTP